MTLPALADGDVKLVHDRTLHGQIFLVLRHDAVGLNRPAAIGALGRQRRLVGDIDAGRRGPMPAAAIRGPRFATRPLGMRLRQTARKRGRLAGGAAARHLQFLFQPVVLAAQPVALDLRALQILAEPLDLPHLVVNDLSRIRRRRIRGTARHAMLMTDSRAQYKRKMRTSRGLTR